MRKNCSLFFVYFIEYLQLVNWEHVTACCPEAGKDKKENLKKKELDMPASFIFLYCVHKKSLLLGPPLLMALVMDSARIIIITPRAI
jgi:hypothetical protein